ncbi:MAG: Hpt domain-containing protein [Rhodoferax sp.]|nr:Hpt domain-containing protein [Rhodoferax sp.]
MTPQQTHIDLHRLNSQIGNRSDLLSRLADAFIRQLAPWQTDFAQSLQAGDAEGVGKLLHKMKGSCHAVSATAAALAFEKAEQTLALAAQRQQTGSSKSLDWNGNELLVTLSEIEAEFKRIVAAQSSHSPG